MGFKKEREKQVENHLFLSHLTPSMEKLGGRREKGEETRHHFSEENPILAYSPQLLHFNLDTGEGDVGKEKKRGEGTGVGMTAKKSHLAKEGGMKR